MSVGPEHPVVGVVGLGRMGSLIARRLRTVGLGVLATDRRPEAAATAAAIDVEWVRDVAGLAAGSGVVVTVLPGPGEVRSVIEPVVTGLAAGAAWIDITSGVPALADEIRARARGRIRVLECPVGGGPAEAADGRLLGYLGAEEEDRDACAWLLGSLCRRFAYTGAPGTGYAVKLLVNLLWFGQAVAVSEVLALAAQLGLEPDTVRTSLAQSAAGSRFLDHDAPRLLDGDDMATFSLSRCVEELDGVLQLAGARKLELPLAERVTAIYRQALDRYGDAEGELLAARLVAERLGVDFAADRSHVSEQGDPNRPSTGGGDDHS